MSQSSTAVTRGALRSPFGLLIILTVLAGLGPLVISFHAPLQAQAEQDLGADPGGAQSSVTAYLIGIAAGQLIFGPLSDRFGRRRILIAFNSLAAVVCVLCACATSIGQLTWLRLILGLCFATGMVLASAIGADSTTGSTTMRLFTVLSLAGTTLPLVSPAFGAILAEWVGWRGMYLILGMVAMIGVVLVWWLIPESLKHSPDSRFIHNLRALMKDKFFLGYGSVRVMSFSGVISYVTIMPLILASTESIGGGEYIILIGLGAVGFSAVMVLSAWLVNRIDANRLILTGSTISLWAALALFLVEMTGRNFWELSFTLCVVAVSGFGLIVGNSSGLVISASRAYAGLGSALVGFVMFALGAGIPLFIESVSPGLYNVLMGMMSGCALFCAVVTLVLYRSVRAEQPELREV